MPAPSLTFQKGVFTLSEKAEIPHAAARNSYDDNAADDPPNNRIAGAAVLLCFGRRAAHLVARGVKFFQAKGFGGTVFAGRIFGRRITAGWFLALADASEEEGIAEFGTWLEEGACSDGVWLERVCVCWVAACRLRAMKNRRILQGGFTVKQHRFWAWGAVICMVMVLITGYRHK